MYCIECGTNIPDQSKFCSNCGQQQVLNKTSFSEKFSIPEIDKEVETSSEEQKAALDYSFLRKVTGWYLAWVLAHLAILLIFSDSIFSGKHADGLDEFWPFDKKTENGFAYRYDITEFLAYTLFPLIILVIVSLTKERKAKETISDNDLEG